MQTSPYSKILIRVPNWLGDSMMATPMVSAVAKMFPKAELTILSKPVYRDFWENFPGVKHVLGLKSGFSGFRETASEIKNSNFDAALILPTSLSSAFLVFFAGVPVRLGWGGEGRDIFLTHVVSHPHPRKKHLVFEFLELASKGFEVELPKGEKFLLQSPKPQGVKKELQKVWEDTGVRPGKGFIALCPGATYGEAKRWPLAYWKELIGELLVRRKESLLILGGLEEEEYLRPLLSSGLTEEDRGRLHLLAGRTLPLVLTAMLARCKLLITNDTGPMHAAAAAGTQVVALFGSTSPLWTRPFGKGHEVIYKHLECSPCFQRTCPIGYKCLHAISVGEVLKAALKKLDHPQKIQGEKQPKAI